MTAQQKRGVKWAAVLGAAAAAISIASAVLGGAKGVAKAAAAEQVAPLDHRVTTLEAQRAEDVKRLDEMRGDLKEILRRTAP